MATKPASWEKYETAPDARPVLSGVLPHILQNLPARFTPHKDHGVPGQDSRQIFAGSFHLQIKDRALGGFSLVTALIDDCNRKRAETGQPPLEAWTRRETPQRAQEKNVEFSVALSQESHAAFLDYLNVRKQPVVSR